MSTSKMTARRAAYQAVCAALEGEAFASDKLAELRREASMEAREAALASELALEALRHCLTIDHVLGRVARYDPRRVAAHIRAVLYTAAVQIVWMDRVPVFAAVDEAVSLARAAAGRGAGGMVNAVLRRLADAIDTKRGAWRAHDARHIRVDWETACIFRAAVLPAFDGQDGESAHLAAATGERRARFKTLVERFGAERAEAVVWASQAKPATVLHRNPMRIELSDFAARVRETFGESAECVGGECGAGGAAFLPAGTRVADSALIREGCVHVQDASAHAAARLLAARPGETVLDLCAAPGGKTVVIAQDMRDEGRVVAADVDAQRLERVRQNAERLGLSCIETRRADEVVQEGTAFDAAMVDVPCTNSGAAARRPEARLGLSAKKLESLTRLQGELLRKAAGLVRPGGRVVYSTCSIEPQENERIVEAFVAEQTGWRLEKTRMTLPAWGPCLSDWRDGGFAAVLFRSAACIQT